MNLKNKKYSNKHQVSVTGVQQGFVLVLVLVLLAVLTLIGVSSMKSSSMELKATANAKQHQAVFQAVQSMLEFAIHTTDPVLIDFQTTSTDTQTVRHTMAGADSLKAEGNYVGCGPAIGSSQEEGKSFSNNYFNITASGTSANGTAKSTQVQGIRFPAAACN